jgi:hypothetical protein
VASQHYFVSPSQIQKHSQLQVKVQTESSEKGRSSLEQVRRERRSGKAAANNPLGEYEFNSQPSFLLRDGHRKLKQTRLIENGGCVATLE